jgi:hypothetical protein
VRELLTCYSVIESLEAATFDVLPEEDEDPDVVENDPPEVEAQQRVRQQVHCRDGAT